MINNINVEGKELFLTNGRGDKVIIPKNKANWVKQMIAKGCNECIDNLVNTLPTVDDYKSGSNVKYKNIYNSLNNIQKAQYAANVSKYIPTKNTNLNNGYVGIPHSSQYIIDNSPKSNRQIQHAQLGINMSNNIRKFQPGGYSNRPGFNLYKQFYERANVEDHVKKLPHSKKTLVNGVDKQGNPITTNIRYYDDYAGNMLLSYMRAMQSPEYSKGYFDNAINVLDKAAEMGLSENLLRVTPEKFSKYIQGVNKRGWVNLNNIKDYLDLYKDFKEDTGINSKQAKNLFDKIIENKSFTEKLLLKSAIRPFLQYGGYSNPYNYFSYNNYYY